MRHRRARVWSTWMLGAAWMLLGISTPAMAQNWIRVGPTAGSGCTFDEPSDVTTWNPGDKIWLSVPAGTTRVVDEPFILNADVEVIGVDNNDCSATPIQHGGRIDADDAGATRVFEVVNGATVEIQSLRIRDADASTATFRPGEGGFLWVDGGTTVTLTNVWLEDGTADEGGAIYVADKGTLIADDVHLGDHYAKISGGAVWAGDDATVTFTDSFIGFDEFIPGTGWVTRPNHAGEAGGVRCDGCTFTATNTWLQTNFGKTGASAIYATDGVVDLEANTVVRYNASRTYVAPLNANDATTPLVADGTTQLTLDDVECTFNTSPDAGCLACLGGATCVVSGGSLISDNTAGLGAIYVDTTQVLLMDGSWVMDNETLDDLDTTVDARGAGGGMTLVQGYTWIDDSSFSGNEGGRGGAISIVDLPGRIVPARLEADTVSFLDNTASTRSSTGGLPPGCGGAIAASEVHDVDNEIVLENVEMTGNHADSNGGAIALDDGSNALSTAPSTQLIVSQAFLADNTADASGGALFAQRTDNGLDVLLDQTSCNGNDAANYGGCLAIVGSTATGTESIDLRMLDIAENSASDGGAIGATQVVIEAANVMTVFNTASSRGGGWYLEDAELAPGTPGAGGCMGFGCLAVVFNTASVGGHGVYANGSVVDLERALVMGNGAMFGSGTTLHAITSTNQPSEVHLANALLAHNGGASTDPVLEVLGTSQWTATNSTFAYNAGLPVSSGSSLATSFDRNVVWGNGAVASSFPAVDGDCGVLEAPGCEESPLAPSDERFAYVNENPFFAGGGTLTIAPPMLQSPQDVETYVQDFLLLSASPVRDICPTGVGSALDGVDRVPESLVDRVDAGAMEHAATPGTALLPYTTNATTGGAFAPANTEFFQTVSDVSIPTVATGNPFYPQRWLPDSPLAAAQLSQSAGFGFLPTCGLNGCDCTNWSTATTSWSNCGTGNTVTAYQNAMSLYIDSHYGFAWQGGTPTRSYDFIPPAAGTTFQGFVVLMHGVDGTSCVWYDSLNGATYLHELTEAGYGVVVAEARHRDGECKVRGATQSTRRKHATGGLFKWNWDIADLDDNGTDDAVDYLSAVFDDILANHPGDYPSSATVHVVGFSLGGGFAPPYAWELDTRLPTGATFTPQVDKVVVLGNGDPGLMVAHNAVDILGTATAITPAWYVDDYDLDTYIVHGQNELFGVSLERLANDDFPYDTRDFSWSMDVSYRRPPTDEWLAGLRLGDRPLFTPSDAAALETALNNTSGMLDPSGLLITETWKDNLGSIGTFGTIDMSVFVDEAIVDDLLRSVDAGHKWRPEDASSVLAFLQSGLPTQGTDPAVEACHVDDEDAVEHAGPSGNRQGDDFVEQPRALALPVSEAGRTVCYEDADIYEVDVPAGQVLVVSADASAWNPHGLDIGGEILDASGSSLGGCAVLSDPTTGACQCSGQSGHEAVGFVSNSSGSTQTFLVRLTTEQTLRPYRPIAAACDTSRPDGMGYDVEIVAGASLCP